MAERTYRFGPFVLDGRRRACLKNGAPVAIGQRGLALLETLLAADGRPVHKNDLLAAAWGTEFIEESNLSVQIAALRKQLGRRPDGTEWITTVQRFGYQFLGDAPPPTVATAVLTAERPPGDTTPFNEVLPRSEFSTGPEHRIGAKTPTGQDATGSTSPGVTSALAADWRRPTLLAMMLVIAAAIGMFFWQLRLDREPVNPPSIAVLPFSYQGDGTQQSNLAAGFTEDVITDLTRFRDLEVIAQNSSKIYAEEPHDIKRIGKELNVRYVLEGSIRRQGNQLRVTANLVDTASAAHVWAERWDRTVADLFEVQTELSQELAGKIGGFTGTVLAADKAAALRKRPGNLTAYDLYLRGIEAKNREDETSVREAITLFKRAIEIDPQFARAWTMLGSAYAISAQWTDDVEGTHRLYEDAVTRAVELDPLDAEAHAALGFAMARHSHPDRAKAEFEEALRLNPNSADVLTRYAYWAATLGQPEKGADMAKQAFRLNPAAPPSALRFLRGAFISADRYGEALAVHNRLAKEKYVDPDYIDGAIISAMLDRPDEAKALVAEGTRRYPDLTIESWTGTSDWGEADRAKAVGQMRKAGFPACASPAVVERDHIIARLPECVQEDAAKP